MQNSSFTRRQGGADRLIQGSYAGVCALVISGFLTAGCQQSHSGGTGDLGTSGDLAKDSADLRTISDLMHPPAVMTTIRDLNDGKVAAGSWVQVEGVVTAPAVLGSAVMLNQQCLYELTIAQVAATPSLHDGILLRAVEMVATGDMMVAPADCQARAASSVLGKVARNEAVTVTAQFVVYGSLRYLTMTGGELRGSGPAATLPQPVTVSTSQLLSATLGSATPPAFFDANAALVRFALVTTTQRSAQNLSFKVSQSGAETRIAPAYLKIANAAYAPPTDGTTYSALTGLVGIDLAGTVSPRDQTDLKP